MNEYCDLNIAIIKQDESIKFLFFFFFFLFFPSYSLSFTSFSPFFSIKHRIP